MAVSSGGLTVDKPSSKGLRELHLPDRHRDMPCVSAQLLNSGCKKNVISARLHDCTILIHIEALELNCS